MTATEATLARPAARRTPRLSVEALVLIALVVTVGWLIVPPLAVLVYGSITDTPPGAAPHFTTDNLVYAYGRSRIWIALWRSVLYATATATLVLMIGGF